MVVVVLVATEVVLVAVLVLNSDSGVGGNSAAEMAVKELQRNWEEEKGEEERMEKNNRLEILVAEIRPQDL